MERRYFDFIYMFWGCVLCLCSFLQTQPLDSKGPCTKTAPPTSNTASPNCSFYGQAGKPTTGEKRPSTLPETGGNIPAKKPAVSIKGRCVSHTENRFRVEVGYNADLITVFKSIPSKNYGEYRRRVCCHYLWSLKCAYAC